MILSAVFPLEQVRTVLLPEQTCISRRFSVMSSLNSLLFLEKELYYTTVPRFRSKMDYSDRHCFYIFPDVCTSDTFNLGKNYR